MAVQGRKGLRRDVLMVSGEGKRRKAAIFFVSGREKIVPSWKKLGKGDVSCPAFEFIYMLF